MMPFFNWIGLERIGVVGPEIALLLGWSAGSEYGTAGLQSLNVTLLCKDKKDKGSAGLRLRLLRYLNQFLSERKDKLLRGKMCCVPFTDGVARYL